MQKRIYKYPLMMANIFHNYELPADAEIIHFMAQDNELFFWAIVDPEAANETRTLMVAGTGWDLPLLHHGYIHDYIGTTITDKGSLVWHLLELKKENDK